MPGRVSFSHSQRNPAGRQGGASGRGGRSRSVDERATKQFQELSDFEDIKKTATPLWEKFRETQEKRERALEGLIKSRPKNQKWKAQGSNPKKFDEKQRRTQQPWVETRPGDQLGRGGIDDYQKNQQPGSGEPKEAERPEFSGQQADQAGDDERQPNRENHQAPQARNLGPDAQNPEPINNTSPENKFDQEKARKEALTRQRAGAGFRKEKSSDGKEHFSPKFSPRKFRDAAMADQKRRLEEKRSRAKLARKQSGATRGASGKLGKLRKAKNLAKTAKGLSGAYKSIDLKKDWGNFTVIGISVLADLFGLFPFAGIGSFIALCFSIAIWVVYLFSGHFKKRWETKAMANLITQFLEFFGLGILDALPFFTLNALLNYWLVLAERSAEND